MSFNPEELLNAETSAEMSTQVMPIPARDHRAVISEVNFRSVDTKNGPSTVMDVDWEIDNPGLAEELGRKSLRSRQTLWLDLTPSGDFDTGKGKNVGLGRLREAVGQNGPQPWKPSMLVGQAATVKIVHKPSDDGTRVYDNVVAVAPLS